MAPGLARGDCTRLCKAEGARQQRGVSLHSHHMEAPAREGVQPGPSRLVSHAAQRRIASQKSMSCVAHVMPHSGSPCHRHPPFLPVHQNQLPSCMVPCGHSTVHTGLQSTTLHPFTQAIAAPHLRASSTPPRPSAPMAMSTHTGRLRRRAGNRPSIFSHRAAGNVFLQWGCEVRQGFAATCAPWHSSWARWRNHQNRSRQNIQGLLMP